ncbi:hypothetical protein [Streptomyces sp. AN091965]|uniref:hypothetical protein n=1 Tax=Streptomyces sp. AN091965 TaxID=2927803 RepID=UPI001F6263D9|nr:hypothetical protein [Streptomyces sp. AN091965]MCI3928779.1 hypothetical protein [Streptomyces sp. AN091965]
MTSTPAPWALLALSVVAAVLVAVLAAVATALLARWDGASLPAALLRAGAAFGTTLTLATALLALCLPWVGPVA